MQRIKRILYYLILFVAFLIYAFIDRQNHNLTGSMLFIGTFAFSSSIYIAVYLGLKGAAFRLKNGDKLRYLIDKIYVPVNEIIIHICIIIIAIIILVVSGTYSTNPSKIIQNKEFDKNLLIKIEGEPTITNSSCI